MTPTVVPTGHWTSASRSLTPIWNTGQDAKQSKFSASGAPATQLLEPEHSHGKSRISIFARA